MPTNIKILIVDDHAQIISGYKLAINAFRAKEEYIFDYHDALNCKQGYEAIMNADIPFDMVLLDLNMPPYPEKNIFTGEDLALLAREKNPECRLMMLTMSNDMEKVLSLIDTVNPNGLVIKIDLDHKELMRGLEKVMRNLYYYSNSVIKLLRTKPWEKYDFDNYDKELLIQMENGIKPRYLSKCVPLTIEMVEKRLLNMYLFFKIDTYKYTDLLEKVKKKGMI
jgi:DNA-binding NarL/FixJ family response regulator